MDPLRAAAAGLRAASDTLFEQHREDAVKLGRVIAESPELQERELVKRAVLAATIAAALRDRGTTDPAAVVTAWSAVAVFYVARNHWNQAGTVNRWPSSSTKPSKSSSALRPARSQAPKRGSISKMRQSL